MSATLRNAVIIAAFAALVAGCGGGAGNGSAPIAAPNALTVTDVQQVIAQAVAEAQAHGALATIAVVDRVGNVLAIFKMNGAAATFTISSGTGAVGGLEGLNVLPPEAAAIAKAITGAYLSSAGNAFSTRTASQIVQEHFNPQEFDQPSGPLFGVQFSQLACSDVVEPTSPTTMIGPKASPLGLSADPGGLPLYKNGTLVGGIGVISDAIYTLDLDVIDIDTDPEELIAVAGTIGFAAPTGIRADHIALDGRTLRFTDSEALLSDPAMAPPFASINGSVGALVNFTFPAGYPYGGSPIVAGVAFGTAPSGYAPDPEPTFAGKNAYTLVDATGTPRYAAMAGTDGLLARAEVLAILSNGLDIANRARAQIRQPLGSVAQVSIVVVDTNGNILGLTRSPDAPVFGTDVAVQKARTAAFFTSTAAAAALQALPLANQTPPAPPVTIGSYVTALRTFLGDPTGLADGIAYSNRAIGNLSRPFFPDGIAGTANGPLSKPYPTQWSIFNVGLQLDLVVNAVTNNNPPPPLSGCAGNAKIRNGIQSFPGSFPIYRGAQLVGAVGVSGDGVDQDDMVAFLGLANAGAALGNGIANAPPAIRADQLVPQGQGTRLRYVNCPQSPFIDSTAQNVCAGL